MSIKITIPNSSSDVLTFGSGNTPTAAQIAGIDSGSSNGQLALYTTASGTSTERVRINASGNVGIGTSSPTGGANRVVDVYGSGSSAINFHNATSGTTATDGGLVGQYGSDLVLYNYEAGIIQFGTSNAERARIDSSGRLLLNSTTYNFNSSQIMNVGAGAIGVEGSASTSVYSLYIQNASGIGAVSPMIRFSNSNGITGSISSTVGTTTYATSSDYRLKENIAPMTGALGVVAQLNPVTYTWKADGSDGQGFIAHELQAVVPDAVVGEKDAVDENGNIKPQGIDTSFLVATLTAAIQELKALVDTQASTITSLTDRITALEGAK